MEPWGVCAACAVCRGAASAHTSQETQDDYHFIIQLLVPHVQRSIVALCVTCASRVRLAAEFLHLCRSSYEAFARTSNGEIAGVTEAPGELPMKKERYDSEDGWSGDEVPLVLLQSEVADCKPEDLLMDHKPVKKLREPKDKTRKKKKRSKNCEEKPNFNLKYESEAEKFADMIKSEMATAENEVDVERGARKKRSRRVVKAQTLGNPEAGEATRTPDDLTKAADSKEGEKIRKEGRYVVETEQYRVIRLTKEQILNEMREGRTSERFLSAPYKCHDCVKAFNYEDVLELHMRKHSEKSGPLQCELCKQYCPSVVSLRGHMKSHTHRYACKSCEYVLSSRQHLLDHYAASHSGISHLYVCSHCAFSTMKRTRFQQHLRTHFPTAPLACDICGKLYKTIETLRAHFARHTGARYSCPDCDKSYIHESLMRAHRKVHVSPGDLYCVECDIRFSNRSNLNAHLKRSAAHRTPAAPGPICEVCSKRFATNESLAAHMAWAHEGRLDFMCKLCGRGYGTKAGLRTHRRNAHFSEPNGQRHTCEYCNKTFKTRAIVKKHLRVHTGERPFECAECGQKFSQSGSRTTHIRLVHQKLPRRVHGASADTQQPPDKLPQS